MATISLSISLGSSHTGIVLRAQLVDISGGAATGIISSGFAEIGSGCYLWTYDFPNNFQGGVKFYNSTDLTTVLAFTSINPADFDNGRRPQVTVGSNSSSILTGVR